MITALLAYPHINLLSDLAAYGFTFLPPSYSYAQISKYRHFSWSLSHVFAGLLARYDFIMTRQLELFLDFKEKLPHSTRQISK